MANAPPEPPSPITVQITGTFKVTFHVSYEQWLQIDRALPHRYLGKPWGVDKGNNRQVETFGHLH